MSKSFTLRLPEDISEWIDNSADEEGISKAAFVIDALSYMMQDKRKINVLHPQSDVLTPVRQEADDLQSSVALLAAALRESTEQQRLLTEQISILSKTKAPTNKPVTKPAKSTKKTAKKTRKRTTKKGGKPAPTYKYNGVTDTIRGHVSQALPNLTSREIDRARNNINRAIKGRDGKPPIRTLEEAITYEIKRLTALTE